MYVLEAKSRYCWEKGMAHRHLHVFPQAKMQKVQGRMCNLDEAFSFGQAETYSSGLSCSPSLSLCPEQAGKCPPVISTSCLEVGTITLKDLKVRGKSILSYGKMFGQFTVLPKICLIFTLN